MVFNLTVTSSSYDAALAMATGAAGAAPDSGAAFTNGVAATMASHSLRVIGFPSFASVFTPPNSERFFVDMLPLTRLIPPL
jgi:hypothetical protein